jgi:predicted permease
MSDVDMIEKAERLGRKRSQVFFVLAMVFFAGQSIYFGAPDSTRDSPPRAGAWLVLVILMLFLIATGGFLIRGRDVRQLLNDESAQANRVAAQAVGFWATILALLAVYVESMFDPISLNQAVHIVATIGVGAALISFAARERRAHRLG